MFPAYNLPMKYLMSSKLIRGNLFTTYLKLDKILFMLHHMAVKIFYMELHAKIIANDSENSVMHTFHELYTCWPWKCFPHQCSSFNR